MTSFERISKVDKLGRVFEVGEVSSEGVNDIKKMYGGFGRMAVSQGLPPAKQEVREEWIERLSEFGRNCLAWADGEPVGHSAVIPDFNRRDGEYIIFVREPYRNRGVGTALTALTLDVSRSIGLTRIWLTVEAFNFRAIRLYLNAGFTLVDEFERERTMILRL